MGTRHDDDHVNWDDAADCGARHCKGNPACTANRYRDGGSCDCPCSSCAKVSACVTGKRAADEALKEQESAAQPIDWDAHKKRLHDAVFAASLPIYRALEQQGIKVGNARGAAWKLAAVAAADIQARREFFGPTKPASPPATDGDTSDRSEAAVQATTDYAGLADLGRADDIRLIVTKARTWHDALDDRLEGDAESETAAQTAEDELFDAIEETRINPRHRGL